MLRTIPRVEQIEIVHKIAVIWTVRHHCKSDIGGGLIVCVKGRSYVNCIKFCFGEGGVVEHRHIGARTEHQEVLWILNDVGEITFTEGLAIEENHHAAVIPVARTLKQETYE